METRAPSIVKAFLGIAKASLDWWQTSRQLQKAGETKQSSYAYRVKSKGNG